MAQPPRPRGVSARPFLAGRAGREIESADSAGDPVWAAGSVGKVEWTRCNIDFAHATKRGIT
jgi:hypothetical protein